MTEFLLSRIVSSGSRTLLKVFFKLLFDSVYKKSSSRDKKY